MVRMDPYRPSPIHSPSPLEGEGRGGAMDLGLSVAGHNDRSTPHLNPPPHGGRKSDLHPPINTPSPLEGEGRGGGYGWQVAALVLLTALHSGCAFVPKSRLDAAAKVTQTLRTENAQLKDTALTLKGENADLSRRALDDSRKITTIEDANERLETSVQAYIDEREDLNDAFQRFKRQAQAAVVAPSSALQARLKSFSSGRPGTAFDPETGLLSVEADRLFLPGSDRLRPDAAAWLDDCASILADPEARQRPLMILGHASNSQVRRASTTEPAEPSPGDLSLARAVRIRDALADRTRRDPARIGVAALGTSRPITSTDRDQSKNARIEIDLSPTLGHGLD
jgi:outer membrane protein OmpA-like peptidoglycan-associated protein